MIVVTVESLNARTGKRTRLSQMIIANNGTTKTAKRGDYTVAVVRKGKEIYNDNAYIRMGEVRNFPKQSYHVLRLVSRAVRACFPGEK